MARRPKSKSPSHLPGDSGRVRIIGGQWRGRVVEFPGVPGLRPTGARIRETLFNWLQMDITGAHCLDLYAGSGVLGFEAISRGAASVTMVEKNLQVASILSAQKASLAIGGVDVVNLAASEFLATITSNVHYSIVFIDPPFTEDVQGQILRQLGESGVLAPVAHIYVEGPLSLDWSADIPGGFAVYRAKQSGKVRYELLTNRQAVDNGLHTESF